MKYLKIMSLVVLAMVMVNCGNSDDGPKPATIDFTFDVNGTEVVFNSTMSNVESFEWRFGDGNANVVDKNPIHAYAEPGMYKVFLNVIGSDGEPVAMFKDVEILESMEYLLTGGAAKPEGKTWKIKQEVSDPTGKEGAGLVEDQLALQAVIDEDGFLDWIKLPQGYEDKFTFVYDGEYKVDNSDFLGGSLMSLLYASMNYTMEAFPAGDVLGISDQLDLAPMADIVYVPKTDATWSLSEDNFDVDAVIVDPATGEIQNSYTVTFTGKTRLVLDEYFGFKDLNIIVIIKDLTETEMNVAIAINAAEADPTRASNMVHLTFEAQ